MKVDQLQNTKSYRVIDLDGNIIAVFPGYSFPTWKHLIEAAKSYEGAMKIMVYKRSGELCETRNVI